MSRDAAYYAERHARRKERQRMRRKRGGRSRGKETGARLLDLLYRDLGRQFRKMYER